MRLDAMDEPSRRADAIRQEILTCWASVLQLAELSALDAGFIEQGGYSLAALRLIDAIKERFQVEVEIQLLLSGLTANGLVALVEGKLHAASGSDSKHWEEGSL